MAKIRVLEVTSPAAIKTIRAVVETTDPYDYIGHMRARIFKKLQAGIMDGSISMTNMGRLNGMMQSLQVKLHNVDIERYPNTPEEEAALFANLEAADDNPLEAT